MKSAVAIVGLCLLGWLGPVWGADNQPDRNLKGAALCVSCHDQDDLPDMSDSVHAPVDAKKPPMAAAAVALGSRAMGDIENLRAPTCSSCHGESDSHSFKPEGVKDLPKPDHTYGKKPGKISTLPPAERSRVCQTCHERDTKRAFWVGSQHQAADIACDTCHQVHTSRDKVLSSRNNQADSCYSCHKDLRNQVNRPSHHPVPEGKMTCSDCHNVHGSAGDKLARRSSMNDTCFTCHAEKRGPFVHQHEPVVTDCGNCHNAHGSTVPGMLKVRTPMLCQQCHTPHVAGGVGALGGQRGVYGVAALGQTSPLITGTTGGKNVINLWQGRSCMNCHTQVHGSNNPSTTNGTPQRLMR